MASQALEGEVRVQQQVRDRVPERADVVQTPAGKPQCLVESLTHDAAGLLVAGPEVVVVSTTEQGGPGLVRQVAADPWFGQEREVLGDASGVAADLQDVRPLARVACDRGRGGLVDREGAPVEDEAGVLVGGHQSAEDVLAGGVTALLAGVSVVGLSRSDFVSAGVLAFPQLRALDALHLQGALRLDARAILTYDRRLGEAARSMGLEVVAPA